MVLLETSLPGLPSRRGKVRDVYDLGDDRLLIVATDRISAFDWVLPTGIPDKGRVLNGLSAFWFRHFGGAGRPPNHLISTDVDAAGLDLPADLRESLVGRSMVVRKAEVIPFECVVRGYLSGSAWHEYRAGGTVCGALLPEGLRESDEIEPIFTPAAKAETGHDENVPFDVLVRAIGREQAEGVRRTSLELYREAAALARSRGLILADTKFEFARDRSTGALLWVDEALTPDSSRYWPLDRYAPGGPQPSFDKQFVRDWLDATGWDKVSPPPALPDDAVARTRAKYIEAYETLTGQPFPWR
ncbi:MAG: phosphoribosylaminoimidazolesuccinocarboxamide synthase [Planctomycetaceae bacterium]|nr:phosphoribosylaminoimidazolesuccinocarboxamide synthase [Planctomycetaceae bacterium]